MSFFDKIIQKIFPEKESSTSKEAFVSEKLVRNEKYQQAYFKWLHDGQYRELLNRIYKAYLLKLEKKEVDLKFHILATPYANGFALTYHPTIHKQSFTFFFDYLKDQVKNLGYLLNTSGRKIYDKPNYIETKEKYYLKPPLKNIEDGELFNQLYGNISIEYIMIDDSPSYIKFVASIYSDRLYTKALPFEDLAKKLFLI